MLVFLFILSLFSQEDEEDCHTVNLQCSASWERFFTTICHSTRERGEEDRRVGKEIVRQKKRARRGHKEMKRGDGSKRLSEETGKAGGEMKDDPGE